MDSKVMRAVRAVFSTIWSVIRAIGRGLRRVLPKRAVWRVALAVALVALVVAGLFAKDYLENRPDELADEFRAKAQPAVEKVTDRMDRAFLAFDGYLANSTLPVRLLRNAEEIDELKRRLLPLYDDTDQALDKAQKAIKAARKIIKKEKANLRGVPTSFLLEEKAPVVEAEGTQETSAAYLKQADQFLKNFERFVAYDRKALALRRTDTEALGSNEIDADDSLEEVKAAVAADLELSEKTLEDYADLKAHSDQEKLVELQVETQTLVVDYYEDVLAAYENLSIEGLRSADGEFLAALKATRGRESFLLAEFAASSSLQKQSRKLGKVGDKLERTIAALGTGDGELTKPDIFRDPAPPKPSKPERSKQDEGDRSVS